MCSVMCGMLVDSTSLIKFVLSSECTAACAVLRPARPMRPSRPALKLVLQLVLCLAARPHGQPLADHVPMAQSCNKLPTASCYSSSSGCLRHRCSVSLLNNRSLSLSLSLCLAARPHGQPLADHVPIVQSCNKLPTASTSALLGWLGAKLVHSSPCPSASVAHGARAPQPAAGRVSLFFFHLFRLI